MKQTSEEWLSEALSAEGWPPDAEGNLGGTWRDGDYFAPHDLFDLEDGDRIMWDLQHRELCAKFCDGQLRLY